MGRLFPIAGIPAPPSAPYAMNGQLRRDGAKLILTGLDLQVGESDLHGRITADFSVHPPQLTGHLTGKRMDPKDIGMFLVEPETEQTQFLPRARIAERPLHALGLNLAVSAGVLETPVAPLRNLNVEITLRDGRLVFDPLQLGLAGGRVNGRLRVDAVAIPGLGWNVEFRGIQLGEILPDIEPLDATRIVVGGRMHLSGKGQTIASAIGNADGRIEVIATGGRLDSLLVELAGLDIAEALLVRGHDNVTPIRCAVGTFNVQNGIARIETAVMDTGDSVLMADGLIDLRSEAFNLEISARAKDPSLFSLNQPVKIQGPFRDPSVDIVGSPITEVIESFALGALFTPAAALLPFLELGGAESANCRRLMEKPKGNG